MLARLPPSAAELRSKLLAEAAEYVCSECGFDGDPYIGLIEHPSEHVVFYCVPCNAAHTAKERANAH